ncbi:MAG: prepilin-type N-terminal cleavage/methylation domain-containing protein [Candidatus Sedimenticola sp. 6PFRAG5]
MKTQHGRDQDGFTLVELMIVVAIIAILAAIAIPAYQQYIQEAQLTVPRNNAESLRIALEDFWLENDTYLDMNGKQWVPGGNQNLETDHNWRPDGDNENYMYTVVNATATTWVVLVESMDDPVNHWVRCEKNGTCCYPDQGVAKGAACP